MRALPIVLLSAACLAASGCAAVPRQQIAALQRENRQLDSKLWEMQFQLERLESENASLKTRLAETGSAVVDPRVSAPETPMRAPRPEPRIPMREPGEFRPPVIEMPLDPAPEGEVPEALLPQRPAERPLPRPSGASNQGGGDDSPPIRFPATARQPQAAAPASFREEFSVPTLQAVPLAEVSRESAPIDRVVLASSVGGVDLDGRPGDDGIGLVLEPWDKAGRMLAVAAPVSVVLIDPKEPADSARVAQWELSAEETAQLFLDGDIPGMHIALPWPDQAPRSERLRLFVRYTTEDGRKLEADREISVDLDRSAGWIATETPRAYPYPHRPLPAGPELASRETVGQVRQTPVSAEAASERSRPPAHASTLPRIRPPELEENSQVPGQFAAPREAARLPEPASPRRPTWSPDRAW